MQTTGWRFSPSKHNPRYATRRVLCDLWIEKRTTTPTIVDGIKTVLYGPPAYIMHRKNYQVFVKALRANVMLYERLHLPFKSRNKSQIRKLQRKLRDSELLLIKYKPVFDALVVYASTDSRQTVPYFNPAYFPRGAKDFKLFLEFVDLTNLRMSRSRMSARGPNKGSRKMTRAKSKMSLKLHRLGKSDGHIAQHIEKKVFENDLGDPFPKIKKRIYRDRVSRKTKFSVS